jgi:hypothetical protein
MEKQGVRSMFKKKLRIMEVGKEELDTYQWRKLHLYFESEENTYLVNYFQRLKQAEQVYFTTLSTFWEKVLRIGDFYYTMRIFESDECDTFKKDYQKGMRMRLN